MRKEISISFIYLIASVVGYGIPFLQNFYFAYTLDLTLFGEVTLVISLFATLYSFFIFGLNSAIQRFFYDTTFFSNPKDMQSHVFIFWLLAGSVISFILLIVGFILIQQLNLLPLNFFTCYVPLVLSGFLYSTIEIFPQKYVIIVKPTHYAMVLIGSRFILFLSIVTAVSVFGLSSNIISLAYLISCSVLFVTCIFLFQIFPITSISKHKLKSIFQFSYPLMINSVGGLGFSNGYRVIISTSLAFGDLGLFNIASQIANTFYLAASSSITGQVAKAYESLNKSNGNISVIDFYLRFIFLTSGVFFVLTIPAAYLFLIFFKNGEFLSCFPILLILLSGQFIFLIYNYYFIIVTFFNKNKFLTYALFSGVLTSLLSAYLFIPPFALTGAAIPLILGYAVQLSIIILLVRKMIKGK